MGLGAGYICGVTPRQLEAALLHECRLGEYREGGVAIGHLHGVGGQGAEVGEQRSEAGVFWKALFEALEEAAFAPTSSMPSTPSRSTGRRPIPTTACGWPAGCQFGLALPSYVPPRLFRQLRQLTRYRRRPRWTGQNRPMDETAAR